MGFVLNNEVNFLTEDYQVFGYSLCRVIKTEFDLIRSWQGMATSFVYEARKVSDNYIALSLRKLLCDKESLILKICPNFKMPPLDGHEFRCPGENDEMKLIEIHTNIRIKPESEWMVLNEWLNQRIAWIEKNVTSIPDAYSNRFYSLLAQKVATNEFTDLFDCSLDGADRIWYLKNPQKDKQKVYDILKDKGYYDLTIRTLIKHIADKNGAHLDDKKSIWVGMANQSSDVNISAISVFATHMMYAATKQVDGLRNYFVVPLMMETQNL